MSILPDGFPMVSMKSFAAVVFLLVLSPLAATAAQVVQSGGTEAQAQQEPCLPEDEPCGGGGTTYGVEVSPDSAPLEVGSSLTNRSIEFLVVNTGSATATFSLSCSSTGSVTCTQIRNIYGTPISSLTIPPGGQEVEVIYSTGSPGSSTLTLATSGTSAYDEGFYAVSVTAPGAPTVALRNANGSLVDRGLCFTSGAGSAAGISCGDLFVTHGMPAYRTKGRDRSLGLLYNSATARGAVLVAADVLFPTGQTAPSYVRGVLEIGGHKDSADFQALYAGTHYQIVLGKRITNLVTGSYPYTLRVRNVYSGVGSYETVVTGRTMVVNRGASAYGRGWGLLGVESLQFTSSPDSMVWIGGDGSAALYIKVATNTWVAPKADFRDTLTYNTTTLQYTRALKHRVKVVFDASGRHVYTINRMADSTSFTWTTVASQSRLTAIRVPPNGGIVRQYVLYYHPTTAVLDSIRDPGGRKLKLGRTGDQVTSITDPDNQATTFAYNPTHLMMTSRATVNPAGPSGKTTVRWAYANGVRVTRVTLPFGATGADSSVTTVQPWDEGGLGAATVPTMNYPFWIPGGGMPTVLDGPLVYDNFEVVVDSFGAPVRTLQAGNVTTYQRTDSRFPALVTTATMPNGRIFTFTYDARANTLQVRDSTNHLGVAGLPTKVKTAVYGSGNAPDMPTSISDALGRTSTFTYRTDGFTDYAIAPNTHRTDFTYATGSRRGLVASVIERSVSTWRESDSSVTTRDLITSFTYDTNGGLRTTMSPHGVISTTLADSLGRIVSTWDPYGTKVDFGYDLLNRQIVSYQYTGIRSNPFVVQPTATCDSLAFVCPDQTLPWQYTGFVDSIVARTYHGPVGVDSMVDMRGVDHSFVYDGSGVAWKDLDDSSRAIITYVGRSGLVDSIRRRSGTTTRFLYDGIGRRIAMIFPNRTWPIRGSYSAQTVPGDSIVYTYDNVTGDLIESRSATLLRGSVSRSYYADGSVRARVSTWFSLDSVAYWYDAAGARVKMAHVTMTGAVGAMRDTTRYTYDATTGVLTTMAVQYVRPNIGTRTFAFTWDELGRRSAVTYPHGNVVTYVYDALGILRHLRSGVNAATSKNLFVDFRNRQVDARGLMLYATTACGGVTHSAYACVASGQTQLTNRYYRTGWLGRQSVNGQADSTWYDRSGNILGRWRASMNKWESYTMETGSNRLRQTVLQGGANKTYYYTPDGDRNTEDAVTSIGTPGWWSKRAYFYDALGRTSGFIFGEPSLGSQTGRQDNCRYNAEGQLASPCGSLEYAAFDGGNVIAMTGSGPWHFTHGPTTDDPLTGVWMDSVPGSAVQWRELYWVTDGRGRLLAAADTAGEWNSDYDIQDMYRGWRHAGGVVSGFGFDASRQPSSAAPAISFFRNRLYDQATGRWTQEDPIGVQGGFNLYQFNGNNPVMFSDPFGLCPDACVAEAAVGVGVGVYIAGAAVVAGVAALSRGEEIGQAWDRGVAAGAEAVTGIGIWWNNRTQAGHLRGKIGNIELHFDKLAGRVPGAGDPNDPRNRRDWIKDIQRGLRQVREHIGKIRGDRNKAPWEERARQLEEQLRNLQ